MDQPTVTMKRMVLKAAHGVESSADILIQFLALRDLSTLTNEDLKQDECPSCHANVKSNTCVDDAPLAHIAKCKHDDSTHQRTTEQACSKIWLDRFEDEVKLWAYEVTISQTSQCIGTQLESP